MQRSSMLFRLIKNRPLKTRLHQLLLAMLTIIGIFVAPGYWILLGLIAYTFFETFAGNIGLHRYYGHNSFKTTPLINMFLRFITHYISVGSVISWVGQHRYHHKYSDTLKDVHSPHHTGILKICFGIWDLQVERAMVKDCMKDKKLLWWHRHYFHFHVTIFLFWTIIDLSLGTYLLLSMYAMPAILCLLSGYVLAIVTHIHGYQSYKTNDKSKNSWIANIYTLGEGWHNNHHAHPERIEQGEKWYEWDLPAWMIKNLLQISQNKELFYGNSTDEMEKPI